MGHGAETSLRPSQSWRLASMAVMGSVGLICRAFLFGFNRVEVSGLENLLGALDRRKAQSKVGKGRERGLLTVCNHVGVLDDPLIWGILPLRYQLDLENLRWSLAAHDICFKNRLASGFFSLGQVLPTHRFWHSSLGGIYQPTMAQAIGLLSGPKSFTATPSLRYSTDSQNSFHAPAAYLSNRSSWVHVFPEACCHQGPQSGLRYFKWGISRLILETEPAPEFVPMFVHGTQHIMPENRRWPRWAPRVGNRIRVVIGDATDVDRMFGPQRAAWKQLVSTSDPESLRQGSEAKQLRMEVAKAVRDEIRKLRLRAGLPEEDDNVAELAETWSQEPNKRRFKSPVDGSLVNRH